jgi:hypothetical protein
MHAKIIWQLTKANASVGRRRFVTAVGVPFKILEKNKCQWIRVFWVFSFCHHDEFKWSPKYHSLRISSFIFFIANFRFVFSWKLESYNEQKKCIRRVFPWNNFSQHLTQLLASYLRCRAAINIMRRGQICDETGLTLNLAWDRRIIIIIRLVSRLVSIKLMAKFPPTIAQVYVNLINKQQKFHSLPND